MKLSALIQKETERIKENIEPRKTFKKERVWLEENKKEIASESLDISYSNSREISDKEKISREYIAPQLESSQRISSESLGFNVYKIVGLQKKILLYLYKICESTGNKITPPIAIENISTEMNISVANAQNAIKEIIKKRYLIRKEFTRGRGSWTIYEIPEEVYKEINIAISRDSLEIRQRFSGDKSIYKPRENDSNSSSKDILELKKETIIQFEIPENLKTLISQKELNKLLAKGISTESLEFSLKNFSYDLEHSLVKSKTSPINLFYGIIRAGNSYKSLKLMELENEELKEYQLQLKKLEQENLELKQNELIKKFEEFKLKNNDFVKEVREKNKLNVSDEILNKVAYSEWLKRQNEL